MTVSTFTSPLTARFTSRLVALAATTLLGGCSISSLIPFWGDDKDAPVTATSGADASATQANDAPVYEVQVPAGGVAAQAQHVPEGAAAQPQHIDPQAAAVQPSVQPYAPVAVQPQVQPHVQPHVQQQIQPALPADHQVAATGQTAAMPAAAATPSAALLPGRFYVRAGAFAQASNADRAEAAMRDAGLPVHRHIVTGKRGTLTALRLGPFNSPDQARQAQARVRALPLKIDTNIFQHRP